MDILWHGFSCFSFKGKNATVVTDPFDASGAGLKLPKLAADIVLANAENPFHHALESFKGAAIFDWPGEYEAKNVIVQSIQAYDRPREKEAGKKDEAQPVLVYAFTLDEFRICHLSNLGHKLMPEMLEAIGDVDIACIPIGGENCLDAKKAHEVIEQIDPRIVIPMYYAFTGAKKKLAALEPFLKEVGLHDVKPEKVLKLQSSSALPQEHTEFRILELSA